MTAAEYTFDIAAFRVQFPQFAGTDFPDATLQMYWNQATCYVANRNWGTLAGDCRFLVLNLMTAHLLTLAQKANAGEVPDLVQNATIDKVTVGLTPPPLKNQWQWWMSLTPYGQQAFAILQARSVGGWSVGGLPERMAFRKVYGTFAS